MNDRGGRQMGILLYLAGSAYRARVATNANFARVMPSSQDSPFPSQLVFSFGYKTLPTSPACRLYGLDDFGVRSIMFTYCDPT